MEYIVSRTTPTSWKWVWPARLPMEALRGDCEKAFRDADEGGKGYLSPEDYKVAVISLMGYKPSKYEQASFWKLHCQHAGEGEEPQGLSKAAFMEIMLGRLKQQDTDELIRQVFLSFDVHCRGFVTLEDCRAAFKSVAPHVSDEVLEGFFSEVDSNIDGRVTYRDFELMMKHFQLISRLGGT